MSRSKTYLCLDIGEARTGIAVADDAVRIPLPFETFVMSSGSLRAEVARRAQAASGQGADADESAVPIGHNDRLHSRDTDE